MTIANSSQKQYLRTYLSLIKRSNSDEIDKIYEFIKNGKIKDSTKLFYLNSIISLKKFDSKIVKGDLKDIVELRDKLILKLEQEKEKNNLNERQAEAMNKVSYNDLKNFVEKLKERKNNSTKDLDNYILVKLMTDYPVRNDLQEILLTIHKLDLNKQVNALYLPPKKNASGVLSLKEYKTSKTNGDIKIELDGELTNDIKQLAKDGRKYLFVNSKNEPYSTSLFSHKLNRVFNNEFGVNISSTILRKIYLTDKYKDVVNQMEKDAKIMGHSTDTAKKIYIRNDEPK